MRRWVRAAVVAVVVTGSVVAGAVVWWQDRQERQRAELEALSAIPIDLSRDVEYHLTGSADGADLTWTNSRGETTQASRKAVPLMKGDGPTHIGFKAVAGTSLYFAAQNTGSGGDLTCRIVVDGEVVAENTSDGGYAIVTCLATA